MKLQVKCTKCRENFNLKKTYSNRPDLIDALGEYFNLKCDSCSQTSEFHANDVTAVESISVNIFGSVAGVFIIIATTLFFWNKGYITNIGLILGGGLIAASNVSSLTSNKNAFNKYKIKRTKQ